MLGKIITGGTTRVIGGKVSLYSAMYECRNMKCEEILKSSGAIDSINESFDMLNNAFRKIAKKNNKDNKFAAPLYLVYGNLPVKELKQIGLKFTEYKKDKSKSELDQAIDEETYYVLVLSELYDVMK